MVGVVEGQLHRVGRRYALVLRTAVTACVSVVALCQAPQDRFALVAGATAALAGWSVVFLMCAAKTWAVPVDAAVVATLCLTQPWTVPTEALSNSTNWVLAVVSATVVAHQWYTSVLSGAVVTATSVLAFLAGAFLAAPADWGQWLPLGLWTFAEAALSRALFLLVRTGARAADRSAARSEQAHRDAAVAAARRADEREHLAALHDTAASTLLAVGLGMVDGTEPWLADQAVRDLEVLTARPGAGKGSADLVRLLGEVVRTSPVRVDLRLPEEVPLPAVPAVAISRAVREALTNVARHAGVAGASLVVDRHEEKITVEVADRGRGFDPAGVPPHRRGLSMSIAERMARAGGTAAVTARPGGGTRVRLVWPR